MKEDFILESHGLKLNATDFHPESENAKTPAVLFIHGWTSEKARSYQYAEALTKLGYNCFLFDMRGHGTSDGDINSFKIRAFLDDVLIAYDHLADMDNIDKENISAVGSSFGGYLAALLSAKRPLKNLVLRAAADYKNEDFEKLKNTTSHEDEATTEWRSQPKDPSETFALEAVHKFGGNILIIQSEFDEAIPVQTTKNFENAVKDKSKMTHVLIKGATHSIKDGKYKDEVTQILTDWFSKK